jgi:LysM repeat protein
MRPRLEQSGQVMRLSLDRLTRRIRLLLPKSLGRTATEYMRVHQALLVLTGFILVNNFVVVKAADTVPTFIDSLSLSDPYEVADTVRLLADYTPNISEDPDGLAMALDERVAGEFIKSNPLVVTLPGETDDPVATPTPTTPAPSAVADNRTKDIKYTVKIGDTLSGIGQAYGLKLATLRVKNNLSDVDAIKPGQELTIPVQDLSDKAIQAAEDRKKASTQLATAKKTKIASASGGYGLSVPISHNGISRGLVGGHTGIDYRANTGTPVVAATDGTVAIADASGWNGGYGVTVLLSHSGGKTTRYGHLSRLAVRQGERVSRGQVIGYSGNTGRSTGPHLHFELRVNGVAVNPF